jgi:hypothetical protein
LTTEGQHGIEDSHMALRVNPGAITSMELLWMKTAKTGFAIFGRGGLRCCATRPLIRALPGFTVR